MPKGKRKVDKRAVPNPIQARSLLNAVKETKRSGPRLVAFFGTMYFAALRPEEAQRSPLAARPYDLRHAAVSTWLMGGIEPARVAEWAGHSVSVLYEVYAAFLDGGDQLARQRMQAALGHTV